MTYGRVYRALRAGIVMLSLSVLASPVLADTDYDVTMRMVDDEEDLDSSFVQEMQIPQSIEELEYDEPVDQLDASDLANDARESFDDLSSQARETRDALDTELPGEEVMDQPLDGITDPDLPLEPLPDDGLDLIDDGEATLDDTLNQN